MNLTPTWPWLVTAAALAGMALAAVWAVVWIVSHSD
jgi:hypothetical protein